MLDQFFFFMNQIVFTSMFGKFNMTSYMYISVNNIIQKKLLIIDQVNHFRLFWYHNENSYRLGFPIFMLYAS